MEKNINEFKWKRDYCSKTMNIFKMAIEREISPKVELLGRIDLFLFGGVVSILLFSMFFEKSLSEKTTIHLFFSCYFLLILMFCCKALVSYYKRILDNARVGNFFYSDMVVLEKPEECLFKSKSYLYDISVNKTKDKFFYAKDKNDVFSKENRLKVKVAKINFYSMFSYDAKSYYFVLPEYLEMSIKNEVGFYKDTMFLK